MKFEQTESHLTHIPDAIPWEINPSGRPREPFEWQIIIGKVDKSVYEFSLKVDESGLLDIFVHVNLGVTKKKKLILSWIFLIIDRFQALPRAFRSLIVEYNLWVHRAWIQLIIQASLSPLEPTFVGFVVEPSIWPHNSFPLTNIQN